MSLFGGRRPANESRPAVQIQVADEEPHSFFVNKSKSNGPTSTPMSPPHHHIRSLIDVGIFKDTIAPSFALHGSLALAAWGAGRTFNRVEAKDWLWASAPVINAWWSAVGKRIFVDGVPLNRVFPSLSWVERLLLTGVTLWGGRLLYRVASRSIARGKDDPRYEELKRDEGYWNKALFNLFIPEAIFQTVIDLPFTAPFRHRGAVLTGYHPVGQMAAIALFSSGFALETLADWQLEKHTRTPGEGGMLREGVWSLVRHPNYLGDALIHFSFPLLLYSSDMLAPVELLGPLANYLFLRWFGGDKENERSQQRRYSQTDPVKMGQFEKYQEDKNSFWPALDELKNPWAWVIVGAGAAGVAIEQGFRMVHHL